MSYEKITKLVTKLNRLTSEDKIEWAIEDPPSSITKGTNDYFPLFFETTYKGTRVAIYTHRYQSFNPETESHYWVERIGFVVLDVQNRVLFENIKHSPALADLMDTVREKAAGLDVLLDGLLDDEDESDE